MEIPPFDTRLTIYKKPPEIKGKLARVAVTTESKVLEVECGSAIMNMYKVLAHYSSTNSQKSKSIWGHPQTPHKKSSQRF